MENEAFFRWWLHSECGYRFTGEASYFRLTIPEMRVLQAGFKIEQREKKDRQNGVEPGERGQLQEFNEKLKEDRDGLRDG